jgi:hypothetical protein
MVQKLSEQAKAYSAQALDAKRKVDETADPTLRADLLEMERGWLLLACNCNDTECRTDGAVAVWTGNRNLMNERRPAGDRMTSRACKS